MLSDYTFLELQPC